MPIYEYVCNKCGNKSEILITTDKIENPICERCGEPMKKVVSLSNFHLKGSGWYKSTKQSDKE
jgi:putative FmdB family regulatory protein